MRFVRVPDELVGPDAERVTFGPPPGHEDSTGSLSVRVESSAEYGRRFSFLVEVDDEDLKALARSRRFWMSQVGHGLQPVSCGPVVEDGRPDGDYVAGKQLHELSDALHLEAHRLIGDPDWMARNGVA